MTAKDLLQDSYMYVLNNKTDHAEDHKAFIKILIKGRFLNNRRLNKNRVFSESSEYFDFFSYEEKNKEDTLLFNQIVEIVNKICYPKEKEAIFHALKTDDLTTGINGGSFETLKANRRFGIQRVIKYLKEINAYV
jgi:hypothetical protein